ncbi:hypothetical protein CEUSTIGMA_g3059.t1 [Chlamydomonas eustigma]|uniref:Glycerol-3-phosphate dehydrogenase [NAD(+)] n=1 Tax=Chlamydomonas eustigma TaxID=1157962 RepID=A0A250WXV4_9CHLO|nr:hypothetical protein CEUSTIGMA_g3059.t1 [Chlamydomonas eustigma]|eukprot:GAX75615.1 hypothetical protein CEUSTIGMA_g3059.t1 [Chlamydomonas eustigma]
MKSLKFECRLKSRVNVLRSIQSKHRFQHHCLASENSNVARTNLTPSQHVLDIWHKAEAVCFDVDCTVTVNDSLDLLAEYMGVGKEVENLTKKAMDGTLSLGQALEERLKLINCKPKDIKSFLAANPPQSRFAKGIVSLVTRLQERDVTVYLISGGFRELTLPIAEQLGIPRQQVFANRMLWQWDDETLEPSRLVGFDISEPTARNQGKPQAIAKIREAHTYSSVVMIGDGITDLEAVQVSGGADLFIGYGGVQRRAAVEKDADWYVMDFAELEAAMKCYQVAMIGSGAWACAAARMVAQNALENTSGMFDTKVKMWVYEENYEGRKLTEIINERHENPKYLPGVSLPENLVAMPDLLEVTEGADLLIFCSPHQFVRGVLKQLAGKVKKGAVAISLIKGMRVRVDGPQLISQMVERMLGIDCSVLMGANIAEGIAKEELSEAVIGYDNLDNAYVFEKVFQRPYFEVKLIPDGPGAEMCGTLKNIVALAAGFVDGLGYGPNSKAAVMRQGLSEMMNFSTRLYPSIRSETFLESCGMADLIATCYGGRNRKVAVEYASSWQAGAPQTFDALEASLLNGQKLQGVMTSDEVQEILRMKGWEQDYPLFTTINRIIHSQLDPSYVVKYKEGAGINISLHADPTVLKSGDTPPKGPRLAPLNTF